MRADLVLDALRAALDNPALRRILVGYIVDYVRMASHDTIPTPKTSRSIPMNAHETAKLWQRAREAALGRGYKPDDDECRLGPPSD